MKVKVTVVPENQYNFAEFLSGAGPLYIRVVDNGCGDTDPLPQSFVVLVEEPWTVEDIERRIQEEPGVLHIGRDQSAESIRDSGL